MRLLRTSRLLVTLLAVALLLTGAPAAWAGGGTPNPAPLPGGGVNPFPPVIDRGLVPDGVTVAGRTIGGLSEDRARSVILAYTSPATLPALTVKAAEKTYTLNAADYFYTDVAVMLDQAYAAPGPVQLTPRFGLRTALLGPLLDTIARADRSGSNARWVVTGNRLKLVPSVAGRRTDKATGRRLVIEALRREARTGAAQPAVAVPVALTTPKITEKNLGRAILVVLGEYRLRLYDPGNGGQIMRGYRCAIGQPDFPTPTGNWRIVEKRYLPTWVNPGSDWARSMPPYIGPGPGNPLGTRALNLNADGIRIHGTENVDSIGTPASHGCIRLVRHDVEELYDLVVVGTPVFILAR